MGVQEPINQPISFLYDVKMDIIKKLILAAALITPMLHAAAQTSENHYAEELPDSVVMTADTSFVHHFFVQPQIGVAFTRGENSFGRLLSPGAQITVGYAFDPTWSVRVGITGWQAKGNALYDFQNHPYRFNFIQLSADAMMNWVNLIWGWDKERKLSSYVLLGVGANDRFHNNQALAIATDGYNFRHLWDGHKWSFVARTGIGGDYRFNKLVDFNAEFNVTGLTDHFNSKYGHGGNIDWQLNLLFGVTLHICD